MKLLMEAYYDPKRPGLVNYLNFHNDLLAATDSVYVNGDDKSAYHSNVDWSPLQVSYVVLCTGKFYCNAFFIMQ